MTSVGWLLKIINDCANQYIKSRVIYHELLPKYLHQLFMN